MIHYACMSMHIIWHACANSRSAKTQPISTTPTPTELTSNILKPTLDIVIYARRLQTSVRFGRVLAS